MRRLLAVALLVIPLPTAFAAEVASDSASYLFVLAKAMFEEGAYREALEHCERAVELAPEDPFLRVEYARFLSQVGQLEAAVVQVDRARELDPDSFQALRMAARVHLTAAERGQGKVEDALEIFEQIRRERPEDIQSMISLAQIYMVRNEPSKAAEVLRELSDLRPGIRLVDSFLVDALLRSGELGEAELLLRGLLERDPYAVEALTALTDLLGQQRRHQEVVEVIGKAPEETRGDSTLQGRFARSLFQIGEIDAADEALSLATVDEETVPGELLYLRALLRTAQGENDEAERELTNLLLRSPDNIQLHMTLVRVLSRVGRRQEAITRLNQLANRLETASRVAEAASVRFRTALLYAEEEDWQAVLRITEPSSAAGAGTLRSELLQLHAEALVHLGRGDEALRLIDEEIESSGDPAELMAQKAQILFSMERPELAQEIVSDLLRSPAVADRVRAAEVFQQKERFEDSIPVLEGVLKEEPEQLEAVFRLGLAYERSGRRDEAIAAFRTLLGLDPDFAPALNYLGYMWAETGENLEEAVGLTRRAVAQDPDNGAYVDSLGWAYYQLGELELAQDLLERASRLLPDDPTIQEHLGDVYFEDGDFDRARLSYERALDLGGENEEAVRQKLEALP